MTILPSNESTHVTPVTLVCVAHNRQPLGIKPSPGSNESFAHVPSPSKAQMRHVTHHQTCSTTSILVDLTEEFKDKIPAKDVVDNMPTRSKDNQNNSDLGAELVGREHDDSAASDWDPTNCCCPP
jgi:hypothetical protein